MKQRMKYVFVLALAAGSMALSACGDDDSTGENNNGGSAGASGSKTGGSSPGGTANKAGNNSGGKASAGTGTGGAGEGGMGGASEAGAGAGGDSAGAGGNVDMGGAPGASGAAGAAGAAGAGGTGEPALVYACGSATLIQKKCSALVAANCDIPTDCSDCVAQFIADREGFQTDPPCDTCNAKYDAFDQCQVDALEGGNVFAGVECVDGYGADGNANCYPFLDDAIACEQYVGDDLNPHACPATWPPQ